MLGSGLSAMVLWAGEMPADYVRLNESGRHHAGTILSRCHRTAER